MNALHMTTVGLLLMACVSVDRKGTGATSHNQVSQPIIFDLFLTLLMSSPND